MSELSIFIAILAIGLLLSGPIALIISIVALNKAKELLEQIQKKDISISQTAMTMPIEPVEPEEEYASDASDEKPLEVEKKEIPLVQVAKSEEFKEVALETSETGTLEQRIGTRWVLIAGIISVIFAVGFFLKYAYDNSIVGPIGRVIIACAAGLIALCGGEITRKRGYGRVAKGVTAMGFAILYAAVFSAYRLYCLIDCVPAFILAILITVAAMLYAVSLNEILIAILSLVGGFLTPMIITTGENMPVPLFGYVLVLGAGAMLCAYYRRWRVVNLIAFVGTFVLYISWFEKFFRPAMQKSGEIVEQMGVAVGWLGIFFAVYLILPLFNGLVKKIRAQKEDVLLVFFNAIVVFIYFCTILFERHRVGLAFCAISMSVAHFFVMLVVIKRCKDDLNLQLVLRFIGLFFLTIAVPLYFQMYVLAMAWAAEGVVLLLIGLKYRSVLTQIFSAIAILLSLLQLVNELPMHEDAFKLILNADFGTWMFVSMAIGACYIFYRQSLEIEEKCLSIINQIYYSVLILVLMAAFMMEWFWHCDYNIAQKAGGNSYFINGMIVIFVSSILLLIVRPICPLGKYCKVLATIVGSLGGCVTADYFRRSYDDGFLIFANINFVFAMLFVAGLFLASWLLKRFSESDDLPFYGVFGLGGVVLLCVLLSEEIYFYWYCKNRFVEEIANWRFVANMYISVTWAIYGLVLIIVGFWQKMVLLRYLSLGLFGILLAKVFIFDMSAFKSAFRITAFLVTGLTLVGISYLYQHLKNKGFFDAVLIEKKSKE